MSVVWPKAFRQTQVCKGKGSPHREPHSVLVSGQMGIVSLVGLSIQGWGGRGSPPTRAVWHLELQIVGGWSYQGPPSGRPPICSCLPEEQPFWLVDSGDSQGLWGKGSHSAGQPKGAVAFLLSSRVWRLWKCLPSGMVHSYRT